MIQVTNEISRRNRRLNLVATPWSIGALVPHDLRDLAGRRGVAAALRPHDAVDDGHADAGQVAEPHAFQDVRARRMLRLVHDDEIGGAADLDQAAVERAYETMGRPTRLSVNRPAFAGTDLSALCTA